VNTKNISKATILVASLLLVMPFVSRPASATSSNASVVLSGQPELGGAFTATIMVSGVSVLGAMDVKVGWNPDVLTAYNIRLGHSLWDLNNNGNVGDDPVLVARQELFPTLGIAREAVTFTGGASVVATLSSPALYIDFFVNDPSTFNSNELPTTVSLIDAVLVRESSKGPVGEIPSLTPATYSPPSDMALDSVGCRAAVQGFNTAAHGTNPGVFCRIINTGSAPVDTLVFFTWTSANGLSGSTQVGPITLQSGQLMQVNGAIHLPSDITGSDVVFVSGQAVRVISQTFMDGVGYVPGPGNSFKIVING